MKCDGALIQVINLSMLLSINKDEILQSPIILISPNCACIAPRIHENIEWRLRSFFQYN